MSDISNYLADIQLAVYGSEVRSAISNALSACYTDVTNAQTLADTAANDANDAAEAANTAASNADTATAAANTAASNADTKASLANSAASAATTAASNAITAKNEANSAASAANAAAATAGNAMDYFTEEYDSTKVYDTGSYVFNSGTLYRCVIAVSTPEAFDSSKWIATTIAEELDSNIPTDADDIAETLAKKYLPYDTTENRYHISGDLYVEGKLLADTPYVSGTDTTEQQLATQLANRDQKGYITIGGTTYQLRIGDSGVTGYITFVVE